MASAPSASLDVLDRFELTGLYSDLCEKAIPRTCRALLGPVLMPGDSDSGVPDGQRAPQSLSELFTTKEPRGYRRHRFDRREMEDAFCLTGTKRVAGLPEPKPRFEAPSEAAFTEATRVTTAARAAAEADAARKQRQQAEMKAVMEGSLDPTTLKGFLKDALSSALAELQALQWPEWPMDNGNPFVVKITKTNAARLLVPTYFDVIKTPMDLTRMASLLKRDRYKSFDAFTADVQLIVTNAQRYNPEGETVHAMAGQLWREYDGRILPAALVLFEKLKTDKQQQVAQEWLRQQQASEAQQRFMAGL